MSCENNLAIWICKSDKIVQSWIIAQNSCLDNCDEDLHNCGHVWGSFGIDWGDYGSCGDHGMGLLLLGWRLSSLLHIHLVVGL